MSAPELGHLISNAPLKVCHLVSMHPVFALHFLNVLLLHRRPGLQEFLNLVLELLDLLE